MTAAGPRGHLLTHHLRRATSRVRFDDEHIVDDPYSSTPFVGGHCSTRTQAQRRGEAFGQLAHRLQCGLHCDDVAVRSKARDYGFDSGREL
jgi:hypothetical protein